MNLLSAILLGVIEGVTEFLPVSSTGHLTITEKLLGLPVDDPGVTAFTAIIQLGAIVAVVLYFWRDILTLVTAWARGLRDREARDQDYRLAWFVLAGSVPIGIIGFLARDIVSGPLRNLWVVVGALLVWSAVMWAAERAATLRKSERNLSLADTVVIGLVQCLALVPGVSRSGATISAGLFRGLDRVAAARFSFLLSIPALVAAGGYEAATSAGDLSATVGWAATLVATAVSFVVAYAAIAWLLGLVARRPITIFIPYRIGLAAVVAVLLGAGVISAT
ncbi:undecaprenyl-diphosphate phosphatase [Xylanimonas sp. McL0601]|uniref:undecaprenyl-diphosphate phosphatase n=1 Tax=Xylanimonas sp. McL0601 TaxID=3414739 RepID=UPI003CF596C8